MYMKIGIRKSSIIILILLLFSINIFDLSGILISFAILATFLLSGKQIVMDKNALLLVIFSFSYFISVALFDRISVESTIKYALAPWGCYLVGYVLLQIDQEVTVGKLASVLLFGFFIHGALNLYSSIVVYGFDLSNNFRYAFDFWQNRSISVTTAALYYSPMALYTFCGLVQKEARNKVLGIVILSVALVASMLYQNRTLIMALAVLLLIQALRYLMDCSVNVSKKLLFILGGICVVSISVVVWFLDVGGIKSAFAQTRIFERLTGEGQDRTDIWLSFIKEAWKYPLGGNQAILYNNKPYVHNLWLDVYRKAGIIPFAALTCFTIEAIKGGHRFLRRTDIDDKRRTIVFTLLGIAILAGVEPIIEANPYFFYIAIIVIGAMNGRMCRNEVIQ